jgi:hypothetical protein
VAFCVKFLSENVNTVKKINLLRSQQWGWAKSEREENNVHISSCHVAVMQRKLYTRSNKYVKIATKF